MMFWPLDRWLGVTSISKQVCVFFEVCLFYHLPSLIAVILWIIIMKSLSDACLSQQNTEHFPKKKRWNGRLRKINRKIMCNTYCYSHFQCFFFCLVLNLWFPAYYTITQIEASCSIIIYTTMPQLHHPLLFLIVGICLCTGKSHTIHCQKYTFHGNHMQMLNMTADQLVHSSTAGSL